MIVSDPTTSEPSSAGETVDVTGALVPTELAVAGLLLGAEGVALELTIVGRPLPADRAEAVLDAVEPTTVRVILDLGDVGTLTALLVRQLADIDPVLAAGVVATIAAGLGPEPDHDRPGLALPVSAFTFPAHHRDHNGRR